MKQLEQKAAAFAQLWYSRPPHACDQATLASMLESELREAWMSGADAQRMATRRVLEEFVPKVQP